MVIKLFRLCQYQVIKSVGLYWTTHFISYQRFRSSEFHFLFYLSFTLLMVRCEV